MCFVINNLKTLNAEKAFLFVDSMQYIFVKNYILIWCPKQEFKIIQARTVWNGRLSRLNNDFLL